MEGGGAKGAFHVGALDAFFERGYRFDMIMGTSIGALNGAMVAEGEFDTLKRLWEQAAISKVADLDDIKFEQLMKGDYDRELIIYLVKKARQAISGRGLPMDKVRYLVDKYVDEQKLRSSDIDYGLVTVSVSDGWKPLELFKDEVPEGMLKEYILASAYFPLFNRPEIGGKRFIDGGMYNNCPVNPLIRRGASEVVAIRTGSNMPSVKVVDRTVKVLYVEPSESLGSTIDLRKERVGYNVRLGYFDALRAIDNLAGVKYYIEPVTVAEALRFAESLDGAVEDAVKKVLKVRGGRRRLIAALMEAAKEELNLPGNLDAAETLLAVLEYAAEKSGVERFMRYSLPEFFGALKEKWKFDSGDATRSYAIAAAIMNNITLRRED